MDSRLSSAIFILLFSLVQGGLKYKNEPLTSYSLAKQDNTLRFESENGYSRKNNTSSVWDNFGKSFMSEKVVEKKGGCASRMHMDQQQMTGIEKAFGTAADAIECEEICGQDYECKGATFSRISKNCVLFSEITSTSIEVNSVAILCENEEEALDRKKRQINSGASTCMPDTIEGRSIRARGADRSNPINSITEQACLDQCDTQGCRAFSWEGTQGGTGTCILFTAFFDLRDAPAVRAHICESTETFNPVVACNPVETLNTRLAGSPVQGSSAFAVSDSICVRRCRSEANCVAYDFDTVRFICRLFSYVANTPANTNFNSYQCDGRAPGSPPTPDATGLVISGQRNLEGTQSGAAARRKRSILSDTNITECINECTRLNCVGFHVSGVVDVTCTFYSEIDRLVIDDFENTVYLYPERAMNKSYERIDRCLDGVTRDEILSNFPDLMTTRERWVACRNYGISMNCILNELSMCFDRGSFAMEIYDFIGNYSTNCEFVSRPGVCPASFPDCSTSVDAPMSCATDADCPPLHNCCNNGTGFCVRAEVPPADCDMNLAATCRARIYGPTTFTDRAEYCNTLLPEFNRCINDSTKGCSAEQLSAMDATWGRAQTLTEITDAFVFCSLAPCDPNPCLNGGACVNRLDLNLTVTGTELDVFSAQQRLDDFQPPLYTCNCPSGFTGSRCGLPDCPTLNLVVGGTVGVDELFGIVGPYRSYVIPDSVNVFFRGRRLLRGFRGISGLFAEYDEDGNLAIFDFAAIFFRRIPLLVISAELIKFDANGLVLSAVSQYASFVGQVVNVGRTCNDGEGYLYSYGFQRNDRYYDRRDPARNLINLPTAITVGCRSYTEACVYRHGQILLTDTGRCPGIGRQNRDEFPFYTFGNNNRWRDAAQFAVFSALQKVIDETRGGVYFTETGTANDVNMIRANEEIRRITGDTTIRLAYFYAVTWDKISPSSVMGNTFPFQTNTYQWVYVTDFNRTWVMQLYDDMNAVQDTYFIETALGSSTTLQMGYQYPSNTGTGAVEFNSYSIRSEATTNIGQYIIDNGNEDWTATSVSDPSSTNSAIGKKFWYWETTVASCPISLSDCQQWIVNNGISGFPVDDCVADICPPNEALAIAEDWSCLLGDPGVNVRTCYRAPFPIEGVSADFEPKVARSVCCYQKTALACMSSDMLTPELSGQSGSLIQTMDRAGIMQFYNVQTQSVTLQLTIGPFMIDVTISVTAWITNDQEGWDMCCSDMSMGNTADCGLFYNFRRIPTAQCYVPIQVGFMRGDPHFTTIDGLTYTFNGWGEYTLVQTTYASGNTEIQARTTQMLNATGHPIQATKFSGLAIQHKDLPRVHAVLLEPNSSDSMLLVFVGGYPVLPTENATQEQVFSMVTVVAADNYTSTISLPDGWRVMVQASLGLLTFQLTVPQSARGFTQGLMGTFNDDTSDDFKRRDSAIIDINSTAQVIHDDFGQTWNNTPETTLFTPIYVAPDNFSTFNRPDFRPLFIDVMPNDPAAAFCNGDETCLFDFAATGDENIANNTAMVNIDFSETMTVLDNGVPTLRVVNGTEVVLEVGSPAFLMVETEDPEGMSVFVERAPEFDTKCISDITGNVVTIDTNMLMGCRIVLIANDSMATSQMVTVTIIECPQCVNGFCDTSTTVSMNMTDNLYHRTAFCECGEIYTGVNCETRLDACEDMPCRDRTCTALTDAEIAATNNTQFYTCECLFGEIVFNGVCFNPPPDPTTDTPPLEVVDDNLSREMVVVITVCALVVVIGVGVVVIYTLMLRSRYNRNRVRAYQEDSSSSGGTSAYVPRMNLQGWWSSGGYGYNPANPAGYRSPRAYEYRPRQSPMQATAPVYAGGLPGQGRPDPGRGAGGAQFGRPFAAGSGGWGWTPK